MGQLSLIHIYPERESVRDFTFSFFTLHFSLKNSIDRINDKPQQPLGFFERLLFFAKESIKRWDLNPKRREPAGVLKVKSEQ